MSASENVTERLQGITSILIEGYKSLQHSRLTLGRTNVLVGPNGAGKSNLLSFFKMLRAIARRELQAFVGRSGSANMLLHYGAKATNRITVRIRLATNCGRAEFNCPLEYSPPDRLLISDETYRWERYGDGEAYGRAPTLGPRHESAVADEVLGLEAEGEPFRLLEQFRVCHFHDTTDLAPIRQHCDINANQSLHAAVLYSCKQLSPLPINRSFARCSKWRLSFTALALRRRP